MKYKPGIIVIALLVPVVAAIAIARFSSNSTPHPEKNSRNGIPADSLPPLINLPTLDSSIPDDEIRDPNDVVVAATIDQAIHEATQRVSFLESIDQKQWDEERKQMVKQHPPESIGDAREIAKARLGDLNMMSSADWEHEKMRLRIKQKWDALSDEEKARYWAMDRQRNDKLFAPAKTPQQTLRPLNTVKPLGHSTSARARPTE